jgi:thioredoxin-like negative regulator of GroEL
MLLERGNYGMCLILIDDALEVSPGSHAFNLLKSKCYAMMENYEQAEAILKTLSDKKSYTLEQAEILFYCGRLSESYAKLDEPIDGDHDMSLAVLLKKKIVDLKNALEHLDGCQLRNKCCLDLLNKVDYSDIPPAMWRMLLFKRYETYKKVRARI